MKIPPRLCPFALFAALACSLPLGSVARAATGGGAETITADTGHYTLEIHDGTIIDHGKTVAPATVGNILDYLKKQNHDFSLALGPGVADVKVGEMILQMDHFDTRAICVAIIASANSPLTMEAIDDVGYTLTGVPNALQVAVFNLSNYLPAATTNSDDAEKKVDALTQIIRKVLTDMDPYASLSTSLNFSYHEGAHLLIVTGDQQAIDVSTKVIDALIHPDAVAVSPVGSAVASWALNSTTPNSVPSGYVYLSGPNTYQGAKSANPPPVVTSQAPTVWFPNQSPQTMIDELQVQQAQLQSEIKAQAPQNAERIKELQRQMAAIEALRALILSQGTADPKALMQAIQEIANPAPAAPPSAPAPMFSPPAGSAK